MLNRIIAISLLFALIGSNFSRFFIYAGFEMNQAYIAEKLCENKSRPWMNCQGKCFLMKKLNQAQEKEKKKERENHRSNFQEALPSINQSYTFNKNSVKLFYIDKPVLKTVHRSFIIFQPPKAIC